MEKIFRLSLLLVVSILINFVHAQNLKATLGQVNQIPLKLLNQRVEKCNIEVFFPNGANAQFDVSAPEYTANILFNPTTEGLNTISWQGKFKMRGLASMVGCEGSGKFNVNVLPSNELKAQRWTELASKISDKQKACIVAGVKVVDGNLDFGSLSGEISHDVNDSIVKTIRSRCESYADSILLKNQACKIENRSTFCDEIYEITINGEKKQFSDDQLLTYLFKKEQIQKVSFENADAITKYEAYKKTPAFKKEQAELVKIQALEEARLKKEQQELAKKKFIEEQELKKAQELEAKRLAGLAKSCQLNTGKIFKDFINGSNIPISLALLGTDNAMDKMIGNSLDSGKNTFISQVVNVGDAQYSGRRLLACQEKFVVYKINRTKGERSDSCFTILYMYDKEFETYRGIQSSFCSDDDKKIPVWINANTVTGFK